MYTFLDQPNFEVCSGLTLYIIRVTQTELVEKIAYPSLAWR